MLKCDKKIKLILIKDENFLKTEPLRNCLMIMSFKVA